MKARFRHAWRALPLLAAALLGGCAGLQPAPSVQQRIFEQNKDPATYLDYFNRIRTLSPEELKLEYVLAESSFLKTGSTADRLRLVLVLMLPGTPFQDSDRAAALLNGAFLPEATQSRELANFVKFLETVTAEASRQEKRISGLRAENRRLAERVEALNSDRAAEKKKQEERYDALEQKLKLEQKRAENAEKQLEALKNIEKSLIQRRVAPRR
ncbi:hypothetical protein RG903_01140 [Thermithiobacillus tepidarius DSM 3134]|uniref:hypothetical protein n=1 Tax=Thermithiobacillus tepidarius TaxID=929 RepID=UPI00042A21DA|nr:hypothetical protein [Thermithiobacillus tepidarius]